MSKQASVLAYAPNCDEGTPCRNGVTALSARSSSVAEVEIGYFKVFSNAVINAIIFVFLQHPGPRVKGLIFHLIIALLMTSR